MKPKQLVDSYNPKSMTFFFRLILVLVTVLFFTSCRKGEDDPSVSVRTRKARLAGEWRLESGKSSYTEGAYNRSYVFDGNNVTLQLSSLNAIYYTGKYTLSLIIKKDGKFSFKENIAGQVLEAEGTWNFNSGVGKEKNKESVVFFIENVVKGYTDYGIFNRWSTTFAYKIKELRNKRLVIYSQGKIYSETKSDYATLTTDYVFYQ